jgi:multiple sugar transport system permease protein
MAAPSIPSASPARARGAGVFTRRFVLLILVVFLVYFLLPLFWLIVNATKNNSQLFNTFGLWFPGNLHFWDNLRELFTHDDGAYKTWLWNTVYYSTFSAIGAAAVSTLAGYAFAKFRFPGRRLIFALILASIMVPSTCLAIPQYLLLSNVGLIDTPFALILPSLVSPFGVYLMRIYTEQALPNELLEAGRIDGAGEWRIWWSVALRILAPGFVTILLLSFVGTWNNYLLPLLVFSQSSLYPITVGLANWNAQAAQPGIGAGIVYSIVIMGALVSIAPLILAFVFLQRYWQNGLTFGSVKA